MFGGWGFVKYAAIVSTRVKLSHGDIEKIFGRR
jgi:hypothetical protein